MAIYSVHISTIKRSDGHCSTAAIAYRARAKIYDERTGQTFDYSKKKDLVHSEIVLPGGEKITNTAELWNAVEKKETRKNSVVAREFLIALPAELTEDQNIELSKNISESLVERFGFASQLSIHNDKDNNNPHLHLLASTRKLEDGKFTDKTRELDTIKETSAIDWVRENIADNINEALQKHGINQSVDHRSLEAQAEEALENGEFVKAFDLSREATRHVGNNPKFIDENKAYNEKVKADHQANIDQLSKEIQKIAVEPEQTKPALTLFQKYIQQFTQLFVNPAPAPKQQEEEKDKLDLSDYDTETLNSAYEDALNDPELNQSEVLKDVEIELIKRYQGELKPANKLDLKSWREPNPSQNKKARRKPGP